METITSKVRKMISQLQPNLVLNWRNNRRVLSYLDEKAKSCGMLLKSDGRMLHLQNKNKAIVIAKKNHPYLIDLIENFDYYFDAVIPTNVDGIQVQDYSKRNLQSLSGIDLNFWFPSLPEPIATTQIYLDQGNLLQGEVVFDLGAYAGGASYCFSKAIGEQGRVYAFEPDQTSFDCLLDNIEMHGLRNVFAYRKGIWSSSGTMLFQAEGNMGSAIRDAADRINPALVTIETTSLSDFCEQQSIRRVDFVKMDIEGSEVAVLESAEEFIDTFKPRFAIEIHRLGGKLTDERVIPALRRHGYAVRLIPQAGLPLPLLFAECQCS